MRGLYRPIRPASSGRYQGPTPPSFLPDGTGEGDDRSWRPRHARSWPCPWQSPSQARGLHDLTIFSQTGSDILAGQYGRHAIARVRHHRASHRCPARAGHGTSASSALRVAVGSSCQRAKELRKGFGVYCGIHRHPDTRWQIDLNRTAPPSMADGAGNAGGPLIWTSARAGVAGSRTPARAPDIAFRRQVRVGPQTISCRSQAVRTQPIDPTKALSTASFCSTVQRVHPEAWLTTSIRILI